jgi:hypothetical protein
MKKNHVLAITALISLFLVLPGLALGVEDVPLTPRQGDIDSCGKPPGNGGGGGGSGGSGGGGLDPLTIEGDETISVGSQYRADGGKIPYQWSLSPGSIDNTGRVTELTGCGETVEVKVTDYIGRTATKPTMKPISPLDLVGPEAPTANSQYSASGGAAPYSWSISCGTIDSTGKVAGVSGCCGSGSVTVTDSCGRTSNKEVRFPSGSWVQVSQECYQGNCYPPYYHNIHTEITGGSKKESIVTVQCCLIEGAAGHTGTCPPESDKVYDIDGISGEYCTGSYAPYGGMWYSYWGEKVVYWYIHNYYTWVCLN